MPALPRKSAREMKLCTLNRHIFQQLPSRAAVARGYWFPKLPNYCIRTAAGMIRHQRLCQAAGRPAGVRSMRSARGSAGRALSAPARSKGYP